MQRSFWLVAIGKTGGFRADLHAYTPGRRPDSCVTVAVSNQLGDLDLHTAQNQHI
ncbi:hypothetical protein [Corynebacterium matruchotii]|uniref:hypothetical protein n=1 Tax=Corynebacterium matruchotii TaxID=43768 RepID=UPI00242D79B5|nr:hypothetical protein [Corynebacterium matruchotii]